MDGFDKILRNIEAEGRKFVSYERKQALNVKIDL